ncbi:MAG TPA: PLP-dependent aminotransferase family protein [Patescibacteria group bacterium]|nr:PLP-dependent aminotransferase family protein [Patescibacteria group bacterium]
MQDPGLVGVDPEAHLYEQLTSEISRLINAGTLRPGERVPSVRKLSTQRRTSISTVMQAYRILESRGIIEARPKSGYYVRPVRWTPPPEPVIPPPGARPIMPSVGELIMRIRGDIQREGLIHFGGACANNSHHATRELHRYLAGIARQCSRSGLPFHQLGAAKQFRTQVARRALDSGCSLSPDEIIPTTGATESVHLCLRAVAEPGDTIAVESPTYFGTLQLIESLGMRALPLPTHPQDGVCLDALETALRRHRVRACLFILNYNNPLGCCTSDANKARLVELLARREIPLIENDIYGELPFEGARPRTAKSFDKKGLVLLCDSFNKSLCLSYRVGWVAPGRFQGKVEYLKFIITDLANSITQLAVGQFLSQGSYDAHLRRLRRFFSQEVQNTTRAVAEHFPEGTKVTRPQGGQMLWVELPGHVDAMQIYERALAQNISILPGCIFSPKRNFKNFIRLNCGNPWSEEIEGALKRLGKIAAEVAGMPLR